MIRVTMIFLCLILAAAAAGRYQAEVRVKEKREQLRTLESLKAKEIAEIKLLRAEIAYLESPNRLAVIAEKATTLKPLTGAQLLTADDFAVAFGEPQEERGDEQKDNFVKETLSVADASL